MDLKKRIEDLKFAALQDKKIALYVVEDLDSAQCRYRCKNVVEVLGLESEWKVMWFLRSEIEKNTADFSGVDLIIIERQTDKSGAISKIIRNVREAGTRVIFDLDDLVFDYKDLKLINKNADKNLLYWVGYVWGVRRIAKKVDGFLCTNEFLGEKLKRSFSKPYRVIRNSLSQGQVETSEKCLNNKNHDGFVVGYFSGSPTHVRDFKLVEPELTKFLNKHEDAKLLVVGYMEFSDEMRTMMRAGRVKFEKPVEYLKLQELVAGVDVNIAPLVINDFTNCKSELKFFEAAAVETTTIASPTYAFKKAIEDGGNGFLARPGEWYDRLEYLYEHPEENRRIAKRAREYALKHYYGKEFLKEVEAAYDYFAK